MRKKIIAGNWKMNTLPSEGIQLVKDVSQLLEKKENTEVIVCPPFTHLALIKKQIEEGAIALGAQNCHTNNSGAFTGEVSAEMLKSIGVTYCIVGHSERRAYFFEDDVELLAKIKQLLANGISPIFCCGELLEDRQLNEYLDVISAQCEILWNLTAEELSRIVIAYEPVWAIGTGETATTEQAQEVHQFIRNQIKLNKSAELADSISILYGGSCKPSNAKELFLANDIDGGLIGGASLKAEDFISIIKAIQ